MTNAVRSAFRWLTTVALVATLAPFAAAETPPFADGPLGNESVAVTDDAAGFLFNPAAGGWRHRSEFQFTYGEIEDVAGANHRLLRGLMQYHGVGFSASQVRDDQQRVLRSIRDRRTRNDKGTEVFSVAVPLDVQAGIYALHVQATSGATAVSRDIPIRIR